jgi:ABC-type uncharacterized transport system substrate-binding protein
MWYELDFSILSYISYFSLIKFVKMAFSIKPLSRGIGLLLLVALVLLLSDLSNRKHSAKKVAAYRQSNENQVFRPTHKLKLELIQYSDSPISEQTLEGILAGLAENGLVKDVDFELSVSNAQGDVGTLNSIFDAVRSTKYDLIFVTSTPTLQVAVRKISDTPVVFSTVADPVMAGAGADFENHLANFTGISTMGAFGEMAELITQILPGAKLIGTLYSPGESNSVVNRDALGKYASAKGLTLISVPVNSSSETTDAALSLCSQNIDAVVQIVDNLTSASFSSIIKATTKAKLPLFGFVGSQVSNGAIAAVSRDYVQAGKDAVRLAIRIFKGENPKNIPFEFVSKTNLIINKSAADKVEIEIPLKILEKADKIIEQ